MSYAEIPRSDYSVLFPQTATHAGSLNWTHSPIPSWGENPLRAGPSSLGATLTEAQRAALVAQATQQVRTDQIAREIPIQAQQAIAEEEKKIAADPNVARVEAEREAYSKTPIWPYLLLGGTCLLGVGIITYMLRTRHG